MKRISLLFLAVLFGALSSVSFAQEKYLLRVQPKVGDTVNYHNVIRMKMDMAGEMMVLSVDMDNRLACTAVSDKGFELQTMITDIKGAAFAKNKKENLPKDEFKEVLNKPVTQRCDSLGKVTRAADWSGLVEKLSVGPLTDYAFFFSLNLPQRPIAVGETWQEEKTEQREGMLLVHKLEEVTPTEFVVSMTGKMNLEDPAMGKEEHRMSMKGSLRLNRATGLVVPGSQNIRIHYDVEITGADGEKISMEVEMKK